MLIDTHCHLDAAEFADDRQQVIARAAQAGVRGIVIPAVERANFSTVRDLAHSFQGGAYALGIHPMCVPRARDNDLAALDDQVRDALADPRLVAIGEIGLDFFVPELTSVPMRAKQELFYSAQLDLAQRYGLPVLLHVRRSQDAILKHLRRRPRIGGIAHAFNGSFQQAKQFIALGFALGMGGAMTFTRALQIRRLAEQVPLESLVLETDAPDIAPAWLGLPRSPGSARTADASESIRPRNEPSEVARIAQVLAELRDQSYVSILDVTSENARRVLPRLGMAATRAAATKTHPSPM
ncbi:MAG: TatD family deoxyribonuclease [Candidimonas sp.]|nr:MAG: TatD family deoxyribonuclease [Candidimonas sp.]TAM24414.1 MAG: TatD family deoxyribonuclease [Candidimonas sp.]TAM76024.1 MAG: TatD family deoxyribonuclease [Candidimonas sp.]